MSGPATPDPLARARRIARLLDSAAPVPGTGIRFGLDSVLGLIPGLGDATGAAMSGYLILVASRLGAPRTTIVRMLANVGIDAVVGAIPVLGDLFDVAFKANTRNLALLERTMGAARAPGDVGPGAPRASRTLVALSLLGLALLIVGGLLLAAFVVREIASRVDVGRG